MCCRGKGECWLPGEPLKRRLVRRPPTVYAVKTNKPEKKKTAVKYVYLGVKLPEFLNPKFATYWLL